jgi:hypothetical protein
MNQLALGIGLSGKYEVNIDGMKAQLEAEKAAAEQAVAARKARDKETSDVLKSATDFMGTSKVAPMYKDAVMSDYQRAIQEITSIRKNGGDFGLDSHKVLTKFKENLGHYVASSDEFYKSQNDLSPGVRDMFNDPKGLERATDVAYENAQTSYFFGDKNEHQVVFPVKSKNPISDWKTKLNAQKIADTEPMKGTERTFTLPGTNNVQYEQKYGLNPTAQKQFVNQDVATLLNKQNIADTLKEYYGGLKPEYFENGPNGQGLVPTQAVIADITKMVNDGYSGRYEELKNFSGSIPQPKTAPASASEKAFTKGAAWTNGNVRGIPYNSRAANTEAPIDINATTYEKTADGKYIKTQTPSTTIGASPAGPVLITGAKDNLYFSYNYTDPRNKEITTYLLPGSQKAFVDFVTHLRINDNSTELQAFMEDLSDLVGTDGKEYIKKYVDDLHSKGIKITLPQSAGGSSAKPASSSTAPKNPFATK